MELILSRRVHLTLMTWHTDSNGWAHRSGLTNHKQQRTYGVTMTTFAPHRDAVEFFVDCMHGGADKDALSGILAEDVVLYGPLGDEPLTGRAAVLEAMQGVGAVAADLTYK